tara:strand:- start:30458 stop:30616 length:159 start_codon:yes stop_codon:yes gene_type:complete
MKLGDLVIGFAADVVGLHGIIVGRSEDWYEILWGNGMIRIHSPPPIYFMGAK